MTEDRTNWDAIVSKAREEPVPSLDVAASVIHRIARTSSPSVSDRVTWSAVGLSVAAALLMMLTVSLSGISWNDPLVDWFSSLSLVMS